MTRLRNIVDIGFMVALLIGWFYMKRLERSRDDMLTKVNFLADHLDAQVTISENLLREIRRTKDGKIKVVTHFIPPESRIDIAIPKDRGEVKVIADTSGFTFRPGISLGYVNGLKVGASTKVFFWGRYGAVINGNSEGISGGVSRYVDDLVPFWRPENLEIYGGYRIVVFHASGNKADLGIRVSW